jgi:predicted O-linked N-acetylglucosamine transferase (SPINDLY family)
MNEDFFVARDPTSSNTGHDQFNAQLVKASELYGAGLFREAEQLCSTVLEHFPDSVQAMSLLTAIYTKTHRIPEALALTESTIELSPNDAGLHVTRAAVLNDCSMFEEALVAVDTATQLKPQNAEALIQRGIALRCLYRFSEALKAFRDALEIKPDLESFVKCNLVTLHAHEGQYEVSRKYADKLLSKVPSENLFASVCQSFGLYTPSITRKEERERAKVYWDTMPRPDGNYYNRHTGSIQPREKIRIAYFSSDFKTHPVSQFLLPVLKAHDRKKFEIGLIDTTPFRDDVNTDIREETDFYHDGLLQSDRELASSIHEKAVDLLVDLTGICKGHRLNVFRYRPAPIQASWIGYSGTIALPEVDYILADSHVCPADADEDFTEEIVRLPNTYLCFEFPKGVEVPPRLPKRSGEGIVFGSFNNHLKTNHSVIAVWAEILKRVPKSTLFLKTKDFDKIGLRQHIRNQFEARGIAKERIRLEGMLSLQAHFSAYNQVDIALDPFPYCGTTTSVEALSMGVPLITLIGERWVQRTSYGFLSNIGVPELAVTSEAEYINVASRLAQDPSRLEHLKTRIKDGFAQSPLCDVEAFTRNLEAAYRNMWKTYCEKKAAD